jgi:hypothetical protein
MSGQTDRAAALVALLAAAARQSPTAVTGRRRWPVSLTRAAYDEYALRTPSTPTRRDIIELFGGWNEALVAAGLPPARGRRSEWRTDDAWESLRQAVADLGPDLTQRDYLAWAEGRAGVVSLGTLVRLLGSFTVARAAVSLREEQSQVVAA